MAHSHGYLKCSTYWSELFKLRACREDDDWFLWASPPTGCFSFTSRWTWCLGLDEGWGGYCMLKQELLINHDSLSSRPFSLYTILYFMIFFHFKTYFNDHIWVVSLQWCTIFSFIVKFYIEKQIFFLYRCFQLLFCYGKPMHFLHVNRFACNFVPVLSPSDR